MQQSLRCRNCDRSGAAGDWAWQRLEFRTHATLNLDGVVRLGVQFMYIHCEAIHRALPLHCHKGRTNVSAWARGDCAVDVIVLSSPSWNGFTTTKGEGGLGGIGTKAYFHATAIAAAKTSAKGDPPSSGTRPVPWVSYERGERTDQAPQCGAVGPTSLRAVAFGSVATPSRAGVRRNCANGAAVVTIAAVATAGSLLLPLPTRPPQT